MGAEEIQGHRDYLDPHGFVLLPRIHCVIAMVRAYDIRAEAELREHIRLVLHAVMPNDTEVATVVVEYFDHFLVFHNNFKFADMRVLAACVAHLVLFDSSNLLDHQTILTEFDAPTRADFGDLVQLAADKPHVWASCLAMLDLNVTVSAKLGKHKPSARLASAQRGTIAGGLDMAHHVWMDNVKGTQWSTRT
jgi:hypothetical protein